MSASTPLPVQLSALINPISTIAIPLYLCPIESANNPGDFDGFKIGIKVKLADTQGNSTEQMYELDTGGKGFWADNLHGPFSPSSDSPTINITYTSGIEYTAQAMPLTVSFPEADTQLSTQATVALINSYTKGPDKQPQNFPIYPWDAANGQGLMGDFGAGLQPIDVNDPPNQPGVLTILSQLPAPYNNGFVIYLQPYPDKTVKWSNPLQPKIWGYLLVGLTELISNKFTKFSMPQAGTWPPGTGTIKTYPEALLNGSINNGGSSPDITTAPVGIIFDTGTPSTNLFLGTDLPQHDWTGETFQLSPVENPGFSIMNFTVGDISGLNQVSQSDKNLSNPNYAGACNTGLNPYFGTCVLYDIDNGKLGFLKQLS